MRRFSFHNPDFEIPSTAGLACRWSLLEHEIATQLAFEEQYLRFHRFLLENVQSTQADSPALRPTRLELSLRAGAIKAYVILGGTIIEGALAGWGHNLGFSEADDLLDMTLGKLLRVWKKRNDEPREELEPIWSDLNRVHKYRNYIHLGRSTTEEQAYWKCILDREDELRFAVDNSIEFLSRRLSGSGGAVGH